MENVGNLVCPASWDLGEEAKVVLFSVTEGEDKPLKYPKMFREARYAVLNKMDLLPHVPFDLDSAVAAARSVNPDLTFFFTSALHGEGLTTWFDFLRSRIRKRSGLTDRAEPRSALVVRVSGVVQGVGFRPFVHRLAERHALAGWVRNGAGDVHIEVEGLPAELDAFVLRAERDGAAALPHRPGSAVPAPPRGREGFSILRSEEAPEGAASRSRPMWRCAPHVSQSYALLPTDATDYPSSPVPTVGRVSRSLRRCRTTGTH